MICCEREYAGFFHAGAETWPFDEYERDQGTTLSNGIGYLIREMHKRGLRIRSGPYAEWTKTGEYQVCANIPEDAYLIRSEPGGTPGLWWIIEAKDGVPEEPELPLEPVDKRKKVVDTQKWTRDWEAAAGSLEEAIKTMFWVFETVLWGEIKPDRHEWLCCDVCDVAQGLPKKYGAASQKRKCHMTPHCEGIVRRLPDIWSITHPKAKPKPRKVTERTAGAERLHKKLEVRVKVSIDEVQSDELSADDIGESNTL